MGGSPLDRLCFANVGVGESVPGISYKSRRRFMRWRVHRKLGAELSRIDSRFRGFAGVLALAALSPLAATAAARHDISEICGACKVEKFATCGGFLEGATVDAAGTLWVVDLLSGNVSTVNEGQCAVQFNTGGAPNGAKFHKDGRLFLTDKERGILAYDPASKKVSIVIDHYKAERLRGVNDLVFDAAGGLYFTEPYGSSVLKANGRVFYLPPESPANLVLMGDTFAFPNGIALSPDGTALYVGEYAAKRILSLPSMKATNNFEVAAVFSHIVGGVGPDGMAVDSEGNLYSAVFKGREVFVSDADGFPYGSILLPKEAGPMVTNLAFRQGYLYFTEGSKGEVWRVKTPKSPPASSQDLRRSN